MRPGRLLGLSEPQSSLSLSLSALLMTGGRAQLPTEDPAPKATNKHSVWLCRPHVPRTSFRYSSATFLEIYVKSSSKLRVSQSKMLVFLLLVWIYCLFFFFWLHNFYLCITHTHTHTDTRTQSYRYFSHLSNVHCRNHDTFPLITSSPKNLHLLRIQTCT